MVVRVFADKSSLSKAAAEEAAAILRSAIRDRGNARIVVATGASQLEFLDGICRAEGIDWKCVEMFHLDEYIGLAVTHPASFRKYLLERLIHRVGIERYHLLDGEGDVAAVARKIGDLLRAAPVDVAFVGIGENAHLAFNDPPADFDTEDPYIVVKLDEACRKQQVGEGWFHDIAEVPQEALSMSIRQILKAKRILAVVPDARKAAAVKASLEGVIGPMAPASILRSHPATTLFLDQDSASELQPATLAALAAPSA